MSIEHPLFGFPEREGGSKRRRATLKTETHALRGALSTLLMTRYLGAPMAAELEPLKTAIPLKIRELAAIADRLDLLTRQMVAQS